MIEEFVVSVFHPRKKRLGQHVMCTCGLCISVAVPHIPSVELKAMEEGLTLALHWTHLPLVVESDCMEALELL